MARLNDNEKKLVIADYKTGRYSQRELAERHHVSLGTINNITRDISADNEHLVAAQVSLLSAKALLPPEQLNAILNAAQEEIYNKNLVSNSSQLNLVRITEYLSTNTKDKALNVGDGVQSIEPIRLDSSDFIACQNAIHKAGQSLGVIEQFAPKMEFNQQNNQQTNNQKVIQVKYE